MESIDDEVHNILETAAKKAFDFLQEHRNDLEAITRGLLEHEELDQKEITELIGPSIHEESAKKIAEFDSEANESNESKEND